MAVWLYAASSNFADANTTYELAYKCGIVWRSCYASRMPAQAIPNVRALAPGDTLYLGFRDQERIELLGRMRLGRPDESKGVSPVFTAVPAALVPEFERLGYRADTILGRMVGLFVEEVEPIRGQMPSPGRLTITKVEQDPLPTQQRDRADSDGATTRAQVALSESPRSQDQRAAAQDQRTGVEGDASFIGIDVGGRVSKGYDLCRLVWSKGVPVRVFFERLPHTCPLPPTASLRACVAQGDLQQFAALTHASASETAANLWEKLTRVTGGAPAGVFIDSPSAFSRNVLGHGRLTEKQSIRGVSFQSTPSICCGAEHGGDWGWLVYGMVAFAACLYRGALCEQQWLAALEEGLFAPLQKARLIAREVFPTATIARLRAAGRSATVQGFLEQLLGADAERAAVRDYLTSGVWAVKVPGRDVFDRADALVAALSSVPYMSNEVAEAKWPDPTSVRWHSTVPDAHLAEGTIALPC